MSLVKFGRFFDRVAPSFLLVLGLFAAGATAALGA
jgi:hypothetical protein